jgi:hypothetical protein
MVHGNMSALERALALDELGLLTQAITSWLN